MPPEEEDTPVEPTDDSVDTTATVDVSVYQAKIDELTLQNVALSDQLAQAAIDLATQKAANYDLLMQIPGSDETPDDSVDESDEDFDLDDLFEPEAN